VKPLVFLLAILLPSIAFAEEIPQTSSATQMDAIGKCVVLASDGRKDAKCKETPENPECVGMNQTLQNFSNCLRKDPVSKSCVEFGSGGYSLEDWIAFGKEYNDAMVSCFKPIEKKLDLEKDTIQAESFAAAQTVGKIIAKYTDGSVFIGFENGDVLRRTVSGEAYAAVIADSPFVKQLDINSRQNIAKALENPTATITKALEKKIVPRAPGESDVLATSFAFSQEPSKTAQPSSSYETATSQPHTFPSVPIPTPAEEAAAVFARERELAQAGPSAATVKRRELASIEKISGTALHPLSELTDLSAVKDSTTETDDASLFVRVHGTYRRRGKSLH
jgi:hypothetical protein